MSRQSVNTYAQHYLYKMWHPSGYYYYGIHSSDDAYADRYFGSGVKLKEMREQYPKKEWNKEIIEIFDRRIDVQHAEGKIVDNRLLSDPYCLNKIRGRNK